MYFIPQWQRRNFSVKGNAAYSYYIGEPRSIVIGWKYDLF